MGNKLPFAEPNPCNAMDWRVTFKSWRVIIACFELLCNQGPGKLFLYIINGGSCLTQTRFSICCDVQYALLNHVS
jgi:hypothetical protein